jgi:type I restriction enzyme S subunit
MSEWKEYKLGDLTIDGKGSYGIAAPAVEYDANKYTYLRITDINDDGTINKNGLKSVDDKNASNYLLKPNDIVFARTGASVGRSYFYDGRDGELVYAGFLIKYSLDSTKVNPKLLKFYTHSQVYYDWIQTVDNGATRGNINAQTYASMPVLLPDRNKQDEIVSILSSLDDKIDLLNRENATLEAMAETLFRQWFIEEAKEDWEEGIISYLIDFNPTRKLAKDTNAPFLEMSNLSTSTYAPIYWYDRAFSSGTKFQNGDTLLARITPCLENGKTAYVDFLNEGQIGWGSTEFIVMRSKMGLHPFFSYIVAKYQDFRDYAESCMAGSSGRQRVDVDNLKNYPISIPDIITIHQFNAAIESFVSKMQINNKQINNLKIQRDILLPELMSNEINIE